MSLARVQLLPPGHPTALLVQLALDFDDSTWVAKVRQICSELNIPSLVDSQVVTPEFLFQAAYDRATAKQALQLYKKLVVRPPLLEMDRCNFHKSAGKFLSSFGLAYIDLCPDLNLQGWTTLPLSMSKEEWGLVQVWCFIRCTGLWPLSFFSAENSVLRLLHCPGCGCLNPSIDHALRSCPHTAHFLADSGLVNFISRMVSQEIFYGVLFHSCIEPSIEVARIRYVGSVIQFTCLEYLAQV